MGKSDGAARLDRRRFMAATAGAAATLLTAGGASAATVGDLHRHGHGGKPGGRGHGGRDLRGMWIATIVNRDWPSKTGLSAGAQRSELLRHFDTAVERGLNAVMLQVRPSADALWPSPHEPWAKCLTGTQGKNPGWDPLGTAVEEAHARGLELHAWFNPYRVLETADPELLSAKHPARIHPDWVLPYGGKLYYNPGLPEVRSFVQEAMLDAVRCYDIDAVHWDDYFYPYPVAGQTFKDDDAFQRYGGGFPDRAAWRRENTDLLVRGTAEAIKRIKPRLPFGISPFGVWRNAATDRLGSATTAGVQTYDDLHADTRAWVKKGWIDYIAPQVYWSIGFAAADYAELVRWWNGVVRGTGVDLYIGEALYKAGDPAQPAPWQDPAELTRHLDLCARYPEVRGNIYFAAKEVGSDPLGAMSLIADRYGRGR